MLMRGDFDLNSVHIYTDSLKEGIKQTMLKQEILFRKQVHELHRIYWVQKSLMNNLGYKECDRYNSWNAKAQSSLLPFANPTRYEPVAKETKFSSIAKVGLTHFSSQELLERCHGAYDRLQQRPLDLQLSADEFINHDEENIPKKENVWTSVKEHIDVKHPLCGGTSSGPEELKLSLSTGEDSRRMVRTTRTSFDRKTHSCFVNVIDLEEPAERTLDGSAQCTPPFGCASESNYKVKFKSQVSILSAPIISSSLKKDPSQEIAESSYFQENGECYQEQASSNEGLIECHDHIPCNDLSCKVRQFTLYQAGHLDLNKAHLDDSSCYSNDHIVAYPSTASSVGGSGGVFDSTHEGTCLTTFWKKEVNNCSNETSDVLSQDNVVDPGHVDFNSKNKSTGIWARNSKYNRVSGSAVNPICPESMSRPPEGISEDLGSCSGDHKNDNIELKAKLANGVLHDSRHTSIAAGEMSCEKSEVEDTVFSCTDQTQNTSQDGNKSPSSCKSCICENDSSSAKTMHSSITSGVLSQNSKTHLGSQAAEISGEHDLRTSGSSDLKNKCYDKKEESDVVDVSIQRAAEALINISLKNSACYRDSYAKAGLKEMENEKMEQPQYSSAKARSKEMENEKREQPQYSSDSFELIAMKLTESNVDDNSVSSKSYEVNDEGKKDFGFKLRRGRRLKDFQKEILPGLASLSRHEIQEDINIMEGVLRSREYRRMRANMATHGENQSAPVRSRRSRLNYVGRRNSSRKFN